MEKVFITGGTGFIGIPLVNALLNQENIDKIMVLVRDKEKANNLLSSSLEKAISLGKEISLIQGDITQENLSVSSNDLEKLKKVSEVFHLASNVSLSNEERDREKIFNTNLKGTKNLLEIFKNSSNIRNIYYFSSAYVCGKTSKLVEENWLEKPEEFRNYYEETKWLSEELLKRYVEKYNLPIVILRPGIIGMSYKSQLQDTKNQTIYLYGCILLKIINSLENEESIRILGKNSSFNLIPSKDLINLLLKIRDQKIKKRIYNLTNSNNFSTDYFIKGFKGSIRCNCILVENLDPSDTSENERLFQNYTKPFLKYIQNSNIKWETKNTKELRSKLSLETKDNDWFREHIKMYFNTIKNGK
jgi:nucleoside-diphosphate-sugar epimerase